MRKIWIILIAVLFISAACKMESGITNILTDVPEGAQAVSLLGEPLFTPTSNDKTLIQLKEAKDAYDADPEDADNIIWYGRRTAYTGNYRESIKIYTEGIRKFSKDARFYRHRGHRYISIREFDRAVWDFEKAVSRIEGKEDLIEPDGLPNAMNITVSALHTNIWYHLGLAYYLQYDLEKALQAYRKGIEAFSNEDMLVATTHWLYMTLRMLVRDEEAARCLDPIKAEMNIIENTAYHQLCLFYKEELSTEEFTGDIFSNIMNDAVAYGVGNWHFYNGRIDQARTIFEKILESKNWASFGFIAAEAALASEK